MKLLLTLAIRQHKLWFLLGDVYHVLGVNADEDAAYAAAENLRRSLLQSNGLPCAD